MERSVHGQRGVWAVPFRFFTALLDACGGDARILVEQPCDAHQLEVLREQYPDWQIVGAGEQERSVHGQRGVWAVRVRGIALSGG